MYERLFDRNFSKKRWLGLSSQIQRFVITKNAWNKGELFDTFYAEYTALILIFPFPYPVFSATK